MADPYVAPDYWACDYADLCGEDGSSSTPTRRHSGLLLSEDLPLRSTKALGDFAEDTALPWLFGDLRNAPFPLIRLDERRYFVADHPATVTKVFMARQRVFDWEQRLETDETGRTWTVVVFSTPVPQDTVVSACGEGKRDDDTGELIENAGDICAVICNTIAGRDDDFSQLRAETSGKTAAGRVFERKAIKLHIDDVTQSFGAIWWKGGARVYPTTADPSPVLDLDFAEVENLKPTLDLQDTADVLRIGYDWSDAGNRALHYLELTASPQRYGGIAQEVVYKWLRTPQSAEAVGRAVLKRLAGERYSVPFASSNMQIRPGMWVRPLAADGVSPHPEWMIDSEAPEIMALQVELDRDVGEAAVTGEAILGETEVTVTAYSIGLPDTISAAIDVAVKDGVATFTITDDSGRPIKAARVSFDGGLAKTTDSQGKVRFPATPGTHEISVSAPGFQTFTVEITL